MEPFARRTEAGTMLAQALRALEGRDDLLILGLPRGGVPVAAEVARALRAPLDVLVVRKLGAPGQEELAVGAIASGGGRVLNDDIVRQLGIGEDELDRVTERERRELDRRERAFRGPRPPLDVRGRTIVVVDDGIATGATMRAAVRALRQGGPARLIVAVPVAPAGSVRELAREADEVVCLGSPEPFVAVGRWYLHFPQTSDDEVRALLADAQRRAGGAGATEGDGARAGQGSGGGGGGAS